MNHKKSFHWLTGMHTCGKINAKISGNRHSELTKQFNKHFFQTAPRYLQMKPCPPAFKQPE